MQKLILSFFFLVVVVSSIVAQENDPKEMVARQETALLTKEYNLNVDQAKKVYVIQARKQRNLEQIATLETSNPSKFKAKRKGIYDSTKATFKRLLNKEQLAILAKKENELRKARFAKQAELKAQGLSSQEIKEALLDMVE